MSEQKADEIQPFADRKDMKKFFDALETVYDHKSSGTTPLLSADGTSLLTDKEAILKRWAEHFNVVHHLSMMKLSTENHKWNVIHCLTSSSRLWNRESNKTPFIWQGSRIGCNTCRDLQSRRSSSCRETDSYFTLYGERSCPSRIQGCFNYPPILKDRESSSLWKSPRHLFIVNCWEGPCYSPTESIEWTPLTVRTSTRKPVWSQETASEKC